jgi:Asp-tRNA(Asn)/Glu-tRNA(Gln) amidotransferase A subunit family amidase
LSHTAILSNELTNKTLTELASLVRERAVSPVDIVEAHLRRIEQRNPSLNAIVTIAGDVTEQARAAEAEIIDGKLRGPLHGVPLTIKDTIDTAGLRTTYGSRLFAQNIPSADAPVVARLKEAGAIILGKTNTPEMAIPYETDNPIFGRTNNPHDVSLTAGGSSGGEAAAIAAGLSPAGIGSDLSGSIRVPANFCGIAGLKPTTGRVPMDGHIPRAAGPLSLGACIGPMARTVEDLALLLGVIADPTQFEISGDSNLEIRNSGLRVAFYTDDGITPVTSEVKDTVQDAARALAGAGVSVDETTPPGVSRGSHLWVELFAGAARNEIASLYRGRETEAGWKLLKILRQTQEAGPEFEDKIKAAERLADVVLEREKLREKLLAWMKTFPLILAPVGATAAFPHGTETISAGSGAVSVFRAFSYCQTFNVFGLPSLAVPAGRTVTGLPLGVQIIGRPFEERTVLAAGKVIQQAFGSTNPGTGVV